MKRLILLIIAVIFTAGLINAELIIPERHSAWNSDRTVLRQWEGSQRPAPYYEFDTPPVNMGSSWYDYFPGGFHTTPVLIQPSPAGIHDGGGIYIIFQGVSSAGSTRRIYYIYLQNGNVSMGPSLINLAGTTMEGNPSLDIDLETGVPFVTWATDSGCYLSLDQYQIIGAPGLWITPYLIFPAGYMPNVFVGASPNPGQRRLYIWGTGIEDVILTYADFSDPADLANFNPDQWTTITIPYLSDWFANDIAIFSTPVVSRDSGKIAIVGHTEYLDTADPYHVDNFLFVLENDNYGEGNWQLFTGDPTIPVDNPDGYFQDESHQPYQDMRYRAFVNRHNTVLDGEGNYHFGSIFALFTETNIWFPDMTTSKHVKFSRSTEEFVLQDLYPRDYSGLVYLPWSIPPEYDNQGNLLINPSWPCYYPDPDCLHNENYHRVIAEGPRLIVLYQTSNETSGPDTHIMISNDYGQTWSYPVILNSSDTLELQNMIPAYWYISDQVEQVFQEFYRFHFFFYDQNDYGSYVMGNGPNTGGNLMYTSIDFEFVYDPPPEPPVSVDDHLVTVPESLLNQNYPNPFNPETTIIYRLPSDSQVRLDIFNMRGEMIKTIVDEFRPAGEHMAVWKGKNNNNCEVASGIYLYRLTTGNHTETRKMLLIK